MKTLLYKAVFFDRDGVVNKAIVRNGKPYSPRALEELELYEETREFVTFLSKRAIQAFVVTNQPDIARKKIDWNTLDSIHEAINANMKFTEIFVCPHDDFDRCECRKPKPGAIFELAKRHKIDLKKSFVVGDRWKDIVAGKAAGCKTIFVDWRYNEKCYANPDFSVRSLVDCFKIIKRQFYG